MKIKTTTKAFMSMEILIFFFAVSVIFKIYNQQVCKLQEYKIYNLNKERLLVLKKYLCIYMKKTKSLPPISKSNEIDFTYNKFLKEIPDFCKININNKPFKIYKANMEANEVIYLKIDDMDYKIIIYGHDINIYTSKELKEFFNIIEKKSISLIDNEHKCSEKNSIF